MKRLSALCLAFVALSLQAQTLKTFKVNITPDGQANMVAYLPENPSGRTKRVSSFHVMPQSME